MSTIGASTVNTRERLLTKTQQIIKDSKETNRLSLAQAFKLYGLLNFLGSGTFGRVGCGGLRAIREHRSNPVLSWF